MEMGIDMDTNKAESDTKNRYLTQEEVRQMLYEKQYKPAIPVPENQLHYFPGFAVGMTRIEDGHARASKLPSQFIPYGGDEAVKLHERFHVMIHYAGGEHNEGAINRRVRMIQGKDKFPFPSYDEPY